MKNIVEDLPEEDEVFFNSIKTNEKDQERMLDTPLMLPEVFGERAENGANEGKLFKQIKSFIPILYRVKFYFLKLYLNKTKASKTLLISLFLFLQKNL